MATEAQKRASDKWKRENYENLNVCVPPELKKEMQERAKEKKMSLRAYIIQLFENDKTKKGDEIL